jgi:hypothetical protein
MVKKLSLPLLSLCLLLFAAFPVPAADYYFKVDELKAVLTVQPDSSVDIRYLITFSPEAGSHPIDIIDIGMPNEEYDKGSARAWIDGQELSVIKDSEYVHPGVEIHLDSRQIMPGTTARLEFQIRAGQMIYRDNDDNTFAGLQFKSTWFDGKYVSGSTRLLEIQINLPPGSTTSAVKYHTFGRADYRPSESFFRDNRVSYVWRWSGLPATVPYAVGASFPRNLVASLAAPGKKYLLKGFFVLVGAFIAFVFTLSPIWIVVLIVVFAIRSSRKRLSQYLPPKIGIESGGIKRGLTPAEAALLQELSLAKVVLLVVFGLLKKGKLEIKEVAAKDFRYHEQKKEGLELLEYEKAFISAIDKEGQLDKKIMRDMVIAMIAGLKKSMEGFSRRETNMYYQSIMNKAWEQVKGCPAEKLPEELSQSLEWLALDDEYENKLEPFTDNTVFLPGRTDYWYRRFPQRTSGGGSGVPGKGYVQTVTGAAGNLVGSLQAFSATLLGDSAAFTSFITKVTNPPPVQTYSGSSHSSGGHSSCACACACASCACACAGGGR